MVKKVHSCQSVWPKIPHSLCVNFEKNAHIGDVDNFSVNLTNKKVRIHFISFASRVTHSFPLISNF